MLRAQTTTATVLYTSTGTVIPVGTGVPLGTSVYDNATVSGQVGSFSLDTVATVTYNFYSNGACTGSFVSQTDPLGSTSSTRGPLAGGDYSFDATYSGNANYYGSTSGCEMFSVAKGSTTTATVVYDASTGTAWSGSELTGASAYDTATVTPSGSFTATGTVTYTVYDTSDCSGTGTPEPAGGVTLSGGLVPNSTYTGPLTGGSHSFQASYSGDSNYNGSASFCERFDVGKASSTVLTEIQVVSGTTYRDVSVVNGVGSIVPTGSVTYEFFTNGVCSGAPSTTQNVILDPDGSVPPSQSTGPLHPGRYSFQASYSGDPSYLNSTSTCEPLRVSRVIPTVSTVVFVFNNASGIFMYDTATVTGASSFAPAGTVAYTFYTSVDCSGAGTPEPAGNVTLSAGLVPNSSTVGPLAAGSYSWIASYSGDSDYRAGAGGCELLPGLPDFGMSATSACTGSPCSNVATISLTAFYGFTGTVTLTDNVPSGLNCGPVTPSSITLPTDPASATLGCTSSTLGSYTVTVTGMSGPIVHSVNATFYCSTNGPCTSSVGGQIAPLNRLLLLAPYLSLASLLAIASVAALYVRRLRHRKDAQ